MTRSLLFSLCLIALPALGGCGTPVVQVAGMGMTGYDTATMADKYLPKERIDFNCPANREDAVLERRMDERLLIKGYPELQPYSFDRHVYLVGEVTDRDNAAHATEIACTVKGVDRLTTHFFPASEHSDPARDLSLTRELAKRYQQSATLKNAAIRARVIQSTALVMGLTPDPQVKKLALSTARSLPGVTSVVDYVTVTP